MTCRQIEFRFSDHGWRNEHCATNIAPAPRPFAHRRAQATQRPASLTPADAVYSEPARTNPCAVATPVATHRIHVTRGDDRALQSSARRSPSLSPPSPFSSDRSSVMQTIAVCEISATDWTQMSTTATALLCRRRAFPADMAKSRCGRAGRSGTSQAVAAS
jgi:hypothetical protein